MEKSPLAAETGIAQSVRPNKRDQWLVKQTQDLLPFPPHECRHSAGDAPIHGITVLVNWQAALKQ